MIGRIRGTLIEKQPPEVLIDAQGVGYEVQMPMTSFYQLPELGEEAIVYTHFVVREDAQLLFGFADKQERRLFRELIKTNGVGPKLALTILSGMSAQQFIQTVSLDDISALVKLPGVGKKTAERLLVEMRDKLGKLDLLSDEPVPLPSRAENALLATNDAKEEAMSALLALGYKAPQASKVINQVFSDGISSEELIRLSLKAML